MISSTTTLHPQPPKRSENKERYQDVWRDKGNKIKGVKTRIIQTQRNEKQSIKNIKQPHIKKPTVYKKTS